MVKSCSICGRRAPGGVCPEHGSPEQRRRARQRDSGRDTKHWRELRAQRLAFDAEVCQLRLAGCTVHATTVHLDPAFGGDHQAAQLADVVSACLHCHGATDAPRAQLGRLDDAPDAPVVVQGPWVA